MASYGPQSSSIVDYFINRHVFLKEEWLDEVLKYLKESRLTSESLCRAIFEQWLHSDLSESTNPSFQKPPGIVGFCEGCFVMQIVSIVDIGASFWTQYRNVTHVADNFDFFDAIPKEEIPPEIQQNEKSKRMIFIELTDGVECVKAIEYRSIPEFNVNIPPGSKVLLYGKIKMRKGILWLTEKNVQLLGGDLYFLCTKNRPEAVLGRLLNMEKYKNEEVPRTPEATQKPKKPVIPTSVARRPIQEVVNMTQKNVPIPVNSNTQRNTRQSLHSVRISTNDVLPDVAMGSTLEQNISERETDVSNRGSESAEQFLETEEEVIAEISGILMSDNSDVKMSDISNTRTSDVSNFKNSDVSNFKIPDTFDISDSYFKNPNTSNLKVPDTFNISDTLYSTNSNTSNTRISNSFSQRISNVSNFKISDSYFKTPDTSNLRTSGDFSQRPDVSNFKISDSYFKTPDTSNLKTSDASNNRDDDDDIIEILDHRSSDVENDLNFPKSPNKDSRKVVPLTPESSPLRSPQAKKSRILTMSQESRTLKITQESRTSKIPQELEMPSEENEIITKFKNLKLVKIAEACRLMKFSIGSKRMKAMMVEEIDPFRTEDDEWTMTISVKDDSHSSLECLVSHELLCSLISMTPAEAIAVKNSTNLVKKREGKKRLESLYVQLLRLDLIFEIEFFSANRAMPKIVGLSTLYDNVFL